MTIPSTPRKAGPFLGNGSQTAWPFTFKVFAPTDVKVVVANSAGVETVLVLNSDYSVSLNANQDTSPGGTITYPISGSPLPAGSVLSIIGNISYDQPLDLPSGGNFSPLALENQLDRTTMQIQQLREEMDRTVKLPPTSLESAEELVGDLQRIADSADNLDTVATNIADVNTVAANIADVQTVADNVADVTNFADVYQGGKPLDPTLRNDGSALQPGDLYFNTTTNVIRVYTGAAWKELTDGAVTVQNFSGDGSRTTFTLDAAPGDENNTQVYVSGVYQQKNTYSISGTTLTFAVAPPAGTDNIEVVVMRVLPLGTTDASKTNYQPAGTGAVARTVQTKLREWVSVKDFGAVGDGVTDDTAAINAAISARNASGGGVVYFPAGTYRVKSSIQYMPGVDLIGEGMFATTLKWHPDTNTGGAILNTANQSLNRAKFCGFRFTKGPSISAAVTGILGGSTLANYNSAIACFENLHFDGLTYGIRGNAEPAGVGIFDCLFKNIWCSGCSYGLWLFGSGNRVEHPRMTLCDHGIALDYLNAESFDGHTITGGIFVQNNYDIGVLSANGIRPTKIIGTWFEQSTFGIINIPHAGTRVMNLDFSGCMLSTSSTVDMFNVFNAVGTVTVDRCTLISGGSGKAQNFVRPSSANSRLIVKDCQKYDASGVSSLVSDFGYFQTDKAGADQTISPATITKLTWNAANKLDSAGAFDDANDQYVAPVPGVYRVRAQAAFGAHSVVGNTNQLYVYKNGVAQRRALLQSSSTATQTIDIDCYVSCATNDALDIRFQHSNGTNINVLGNVETTFFSVEFVSPL